MNNLSVNEAKMLLVQSLCTAYANEQAAARAYTGHSKGLFIHSQERKHIYGIAQSEWRHVRTVEDMLDQLRVQRPKARPLIMRRLGSMIGWLCIFGGRLAPMYGAGWLESDVVNIYIKTAQYAWLANHQELIPELLNMAEEEWDHEHYFRQNVEQHKIGKHLKIWPRPEPREHLRTNFARFCQNQHQQRICNDLQQLNPTP